MNTGKRSKGGSESKPLAERITPEAKGDKDRVVEVINVSDPNGRMRVHIDKMRNARPQCAKPSCKRQVRLAAITENTPFDKRPVANCQTQSGRNVCSYYHYACAPKSFHEAVAAANQPALEEALT